ncbi:hypothetical protein HAV18_15185 [Burkholderia sp. D-99]|nr:hypothetical protein [Burkholderia sp. D-99]
MLRGKRYKRTLTEAIAETFLTSIHRDDGSVGLKTALSALEAHFLYLETKRVSPAHQERNLHARFSALLAADDSINVDEDEEHLEAIRGRTDIGATTKEQLVKSRRGQGLFKANVRLNERRCRVTKIEDPAHLRASHIKPWRDSSDEEKLNGCNGLLLAPHVDHLFDKGAISFADNGDLLVSPLLDSSVLIAWGIPAVLNVGPFNPEQAKFLLYHREKYHFA